ncbi:hypothetical protein ACCQ05_18425 [Xanthomonas sp. NCPPB 3582]|uniref:hypothetical protein n=1 Tax=Xanthomonas sp. NCPPB 3582 TaxID=487557 RepID=UPI003557E15F
MQLTPYIDRQIFTFAMSMHGTPDPDTNEDEIPLEERPPQKGGLRDEVGELERTDDSALPGRVGGGLAGG